LGSSSNAFHRRSRKNTLELATRKRISSEVAPGLLTMSAMEFPGSLLIKQQTPGSPVAQSLTGVGREI
jgi:hypothetical protein